MGSGFLAEICRDWEHCASPAADAGIRTVLLRTGMVLSADGGALAKMLPLFKAGLGGRLGSGKQYWSWISIADQVSLIEQLLSADVSGPVNLTGPAPVTNAEFTKVLGKVLRRPTVLAVPAFAPRILLGAEMANELVFSSTRAIPQVATSVGYSFTHPTLEDALRGVLAK